MKTALDSLSSCLGPDRVQTGSEVCRLLSEDIAGPGEGVLSAVIRPSSSDDLAAAVRVAYEHGLALYPRGGGMSYTGGYVPGPIGGIGVDLTDMDRVHDIDADARTVTVECGCTWAKLHDALLSKGWRTSFFGPLSGIAASIGGALSQNASFFGSASGGYAAEGVIGLEIVDGTGRSHRIGSWGAGRHSGLRYFGPDFVGSFVGDCGAFGIKTRAVLRIKPQPPAAHFMAFAFDRPEDLTAAMAELSELPHLSETWALDARAHQNFSKAGFSTLESVTIASEIAGGSGSLVGAIKNLASAAKLRSVTLKDLAWSLNIVVEPPLEELIPATAAAVEQTVARHNGTAIPDTIPRVTRAKPFRTIKALVGPDGERWLPCHGIAPAHLAWSALNQVQQTLDRRKNDMGEAGMYATVLLASVASDIIVEPQLFWSDALSGFQRARATAGQVSAHADAPDNPKGRALANDIREELTAGLADAGCTHLQIGRHYRYFPDLEPGMADLVLSIKRSFDPAGILNPGVLGLPSSG